MPRILLIFLALATTGANEGAPAAAKPSPSTDGAAVFERHACGTCHSVDGSKRVGPPLKGLFGSRVRTTRGEEVVVDEAYVRESIVSPNARVVAGYPPTMPRYGNLLSAEEVDALVAYVKRLGK